MRCARTKLNTQERRETRGLGGRQESKNEVACLFQRPGTTRVVREGGGLLSRGEAGRGGDGEVEKSAAQLQGHQALCGQHRKLPSVSERAYVQHHCSVMEESGRTDSAESMPRLPMGRRLRLHRVSSRHLAKGLGELALAPPAVPSLLSATFPFLGHSHPESSMEPSALRLPASAASVCRTSFLRIPSD